VILDYKETSYCKSDCFHTWWNNGQQLTFNILVDQPTNSSLNFKIKRGWGL